MPQKKLRISLKLNEYFRLLHLPTTSCILAFAIIGSISAPIFYFDRLLLLLLQLFLVGGVSANFFDEIRGRPWHTTIPETHLWLIGISSLLLSNLIGLYLTLKVAWFFWIFSLIWSFFAIAYDLELFNGLFHNTPSLAISWGFVCLGSYYLQSLTITPQIIIISLVNGGIAGYGRELYEVAKPFGKDNDPFSSSESRVAWTLLHRQILIVNIIALTMLTYRLLF
jgi:hypothetical protein